MAAAMVALWAALTAGQWVQKKVESVCLTVGWMVHTKAVPLAAGWAVPLAWKMAVWSVGQLDRRLDLLGNSLDCSWEWKAAKWVGLLVVLTAVPKASRKERCSVVSSVVSLVVLLVAEMVFEKAAKKAALSACEGHK